MHPYRAATRTLFATSLIFAACSDTADPIGALDPALALDPTSIDFGNVQVGTEKVLRVAVKNDGDGVLVLAAVSKNEPWDEAFSFTIEPTTIAAKSQGLLTVAFRPLTIGPKTAAIRIRTADPEQIPDVDVQIRGTGATAELKIEPESISFGNVVVPTAKTVPVVVTNTTDIPAKVAYAPASNVKLCGAAGGDPSTFCFATTTKILDAQSEFDLAPNESATFNVTFQPTVVGTRERGEFTFQACESCPEQSVRLDGIGVERGFVCSPAALDFGLVNPGSCLTRNVVCENVANEQVSIVGWAPGPNSSADFSLEPFGQVVVVSTGQSFDVDVSYCPEELGNDSGQLYVETDIPDPNRRFVQIALTGNGGGPDIDVQPPRLNFGQVSLIAPARRTVQIANVGFQDLEILQVTDDADGTGAFKVVGATPTTIERGGFGDLTVEFQPQLEGPITSRLIIRSSDQDEAETVVELRGEGINLPPCQFETVPTTLSFGIVERGRMASRAFEVRNLGQSDCLLTGVRMLPGADQEFTLPDGDVSSLRIPPASSSTFRVQYAPLDAATHNGEVEFSISSPTSPFNTVQLSGTGADAVLLITPNELAFGTIGIGCNAREREVTIYNTGATDARIDSIALAAPASPAFTVLSVPMPLPANALTLAPGDSATFRVGFRATAGASYAGAVEINGSFNGQPVTYLVALTGAGAAEAVQTDEFDQLGRPKADILFVIDDSCSMSEEQTSLGGNFAAFLQFAQAQNIDYQIAVTTTDVDGTGAQGRFVPEAGGDRIVRPATQPSPEQVFATNVNVGIDGSAFEQGLEAAYLALSNPLIFGHNSGFLRPDAVLSVIIVSDEEDQSPDPVDFYVNFFLSIKGFRNTNLFTLSSIVGDTPMGCNGPGGNAADGIRYIEATRRTGGVFQSICVSDWSRALEDLSATAFGFKSRFFLSNQPVISSLRVYVDMVELQAAGMGGSINWSYDFPTNTINFTPFSTPEPGAHIQVDYTVECL